MIEGRTEYLRHVVAVDVGAVGTESAVCALAVRDTVGWLPGGLHTRGVRRLVVLGLETLRGLPHAAAEGPSVLGTALEMIGTVTAAAAEKARQGGGATVTVEVVTSMGLVGPPFADRLEAQIRERRLRAKPHRLVVTAGYTEVWEKEHGVFTAGKTVLIGQAQLALAERRLEYADALAEMPGVVERLRVYRTTVFPPREQAWDQREGGGEGEAAVGALAAAVWWASSRMPPPSGPVSTEPLARRR